MPDYLIQRDLVVWSLQHSLTNGRQGLSDVPGLVTRVVAEDCWRERLVRVTGQRAEFSRFEEFVRESPPEGLGADLADVERLCRDDPQALDALDRVTVGRQGARTDLFNNVQEVSPPPVGNSARAALRTLRKRRPDLHTRVMAKELSSHQAMREAGFRPPTLTVRADDMVSAAGTLRRHLSPDLLRALIQELTEGQE